MVYDGLTSAARVYESFWTLGSSPDRSLPPSWIHITEVLADLVDLSFPTASVWVGELATLSLDARTCCKLCRGSGSSFRLDEEIWASWFPVSEGGRMFDCTAELDSVSECGLTRGGSSSSIAWRGGH